LSGPGTDFALSRENAVRESRAQHNPRLNIQAGPPQGVQNRRNACVLDAALDRGASGSGGIRLCDCVANSIVSTATGYPKPSSAEARCAPVAFSEAVMSELGLALGAPEPAAAPAVPRLHLDPSADALSAPI
jgi:hypothetical protein